MKRFKRCLAAALAGLLAVSLLPTPVMAEENTESEVRKVAAKEVEVESSLSPDNARKPTAEQNIYDDDAVVTAIVEFEAPAVMDYYDTSTYARLAEDTSAGQAVSDFLASEDAQQTAQELLDDQESVIGKITAITADSSASPMMLDGSGSADGIVARWSVLINGMAIQVPYGTLDEIREVDGVKRAYVQHVYDYPDDETVSVDDPWYSYSYDKVGVQEAWAEGYTGKGMLVAVLDTGLDISWSVTGEGVSRSHEAFRDNSFKNDPDAEEGGWDLRYDYDSLEKFLEDNQLNSTTGLDHDGDGVGDKIEWDNNALYKNLKVPYACDYADGDINVQPADSDHGTHVSGTVGGYAETEEGEVIFSGVAPDAQIMMMKVFSDQGGGAMEVTIINALEDTLKLGADVVNLSLGSDNGFSEDDTAQNEMYARVEKAGIALMTSAGNSSYSSASNNYGGNPLTDNVDTSMMSSPAIYDSNLSVASLENAIQVSPYLTWKGADGTAHDASYADPWTVAMKATFANGKEYPVYLVNGVGTSSDYSEVGWYNEYTNPNGKTGFALVARGEISFADKINNAQSFTSVDYRTGERRGVLGVLVYDTDPESSELINMSVENTSLTCAFISGKDGAPLAAALQNGEEVTITVAAEDKASVSATDGQMSSFSSWGAGPSLELKPEITAPGGNIWSTIVDQANTAIDGYTGSYGMMSGTSMAAPHMSGIAALVRQRVLDEDAFDGIDPGEVDDIISQLLVSTAIPQKDTADVYYSPRQQGAGLVNVHNALNTPAYITVDGQNVGKLELKDDPARNGSYPVEFQVHNISDSSVTYNVSATLMRPATVEAESVWGTRNTMAHQDVVIKTVDLGTVTVDAGKTASVSQTISLTADEKAVLNELFVNGVYVEGFVTLSDTAETAPTLGLPMLAFYGDWTKAPIFDASDWTDDAEDGENVSNNESTWGVSRLGSAIINQYDIIGYFDLGQNPFDPDAVMEQTTYHEENITISPNGDEYFDRVDDYILYQLRDAKVIVVRVTDADTGEVYFSEWTSYIPRTLFDSSYGLAIPLSAQYYGLIPIWDGTDKEGEVLPSGTKCTYEIIAYGDGDYGDTIYEEETGLNVTNFDAVASGDLVPEFNNHEMDMTGDVISFPITVDTVAPELENHTVSIYEEDGRVYMSGTVNEEDGALASVQIFPYVTRSYKEGYGDPNYSEVGIDRNNPFLTEMFYDAATKTYTFKADVTEYAHTNQSYEGENNYYDFEWTGNVLVNCGDYGANERSYSIAVNTTKGLVLSQTSALLKPGSTFDLSVIDNSGEEGEITRTSSNPEVATIDEMGKVTAVAPGQTVITVSKGDSTAICVVAVQAANTEVLDFDLSLTDFDGLKPDGQLTVKVDNLQPADVVLDEIRWEVYEDEDYAENYASGLLDVEQYSSDGLSGTVYMTIGATQEDLALPAGTGYLNVTLNGVTRTLDLSWPALPKSGNEEDLISDLNMGDQVVYVDQGETAELIAAYRNRSEHSVNEVDASDLVGLKLDGPDFYSVGGSYEATLVNEEGYKLPEEVHLYTRYSDGYEVEIINYSWYSPYSYDPATGKLVVQYAPSGADNVLVIRAEGVESKGEPAGKLSGKTWERPEPLYGPFDWEVTDGKGELTKGTKVNSGEEIETALFTPSEPGVSYITATTKDGKYSLNFAVVCEGVLPESIDLDYHYLSLDPGEEAELAPVLSPEPTLEKDAEVTYTSFDPDVATVDENGVVTGVSEGYAYIKVASAADNRIFTYCIVQVNEKMYNVKFVDYDGTVIKDVKVAPGDSAIAPEDPQREGYTFTGWDTDFTNVTSDLVVKAEYKANRYTVSFVADGKVIDTIEKEYGQTLTAEDYPEVPAREGYIGTWKKTNEPITGPTTIEAVYTPSSTLPPDGDIMGGSNIGTGSGSGSNGGSGSDTPNTSDTAPIALAVNLFFCSGIVLAFLVLRRRKNER